MGSTARHIKNFNGRLTDDVPSARTFDRIYSSVFAANSDRAGSDLRARDGQPRHVEAGIKLAQLRKTRRESEHVHVVNWRRMKLADLRDAHLFRFRHARQIFAIIYDWNFLDGSRGRFKSNSGFESIE